MTFVLSPCYAKYIFAVLYALKIAHILLDYAINNKLSPFISMQNHYNLLYREEEREVFPTLKVGWYMCVLPIRNFTVKTVPSISGLDLFHGRLLLGVFLRAPC